MAHEEEEALPHEVADEHPERKRAEARVAHLLCLYAERLIGQQDAPEEKPSREHAGPGGKRQHLMGEQAGDPDDGERPVLSAERTGHYGVREHELPREGAERVHGLRRGAGPVKELSADLSVEDARGEAVHLLKAVAFKRRHECLPLVLREGLLRLHVLET